MIQEIKPYSIRWAKMEEWPIAMELAWSTFQKFEQEDYTPEGIEKFYKFVKGKELFRMFLKKQYKLAIVSRNEVIVGMISLRSGNHISLLFVDEKYHKLGIGTYLVQFLAEYVKKEVSRDCITVESSPYAVEFYHKIGFKDNGEMKEMSGIITTPMKKMI